MCFMKLSMGRIGTCVAFSLMQLKIGTTLLLILPTFEHLKKHLISLYRPDGRSIFGIHNPKLRYIFQLRVGPVSYTHLTLPTKA